MNYFELTKKAKKRYSQERKDGNSHPNTYVLEWLEEHCSSEQAEEILSIAIMDYENN